MDFKQYQRKAVSFAIYPKEYKLIYPAMGLCGEAGEVAEKVKKLIRDGTLNRYEVALEASDVLWYNTNFVNDLGFTLEEIAIMNIEKLESRKERGVIQGSGDNR